VALGLISDIHGNFPALLSVLGELDNFGVKEIVCLGDTAGYYPMVNECIAELRKRHIRSVMGNHDWYLAAGKCLRSSAVTACIDYQKSIVTAENLLWLQSLPLELKINGVRIVHGGWSDPIDEYLDPKPGYFQNLEGLFFASGHSHIPQIIFDGDKTWCNPGSVGQPRDNNPHASFGIFEENRFQIYRTKYDVESVINECKKFGLPEKIYGGLAVGSKKLIVMAEAIQSPGNHD
jgi:predicted phosphodiesterase